MSTPTTSDQSESDTPEWVGKSIPPKSSERFVTGSGEYVDDIQLPQMLHCAILRSPHAHARIEQIDVSDAREHSDVEAVITGADAKAVMNPLPSLIDLTEYGEFREPEAYSLAVDKVRYVGQPVAAVAATDPYVAEDALDLIDVDYDTLPAVVDGKDALEDDAPLLYEDWDDNVQWHYEDSFGDVEQAFDEADEVINEELYEHRYSGFPIEPRGAVAQYKPREEKLKLWESTQAPHLARQYIADALNLAESNVRVIAPDIGGGFGNKLNYTDDMIACLLSMETGRPVKWIERRQSNLQASPHARDYYFDVDVACDEDGTIRGVDIDIIWNNGVEGSNRGSGIGQPLVGLFYAPGPYEIDGLRVQADGVVTNKSFSCAYRGYGKDVANRFLERMINIVSRRMDLDPAEVRFKNFIPSDAFPYEQITGPVYGSGDYQQLLETVLDAVNYDELRKEQEELRDEGKYLGIGIGAMLEPAGAAVPFCVYAGFESATVKVLPSGGVQLMTPLTNIGQASETYMAQVVSDELGVPPDEVSVIEGDSERTPMGAGPWSSRGAVWGASAVSAAAQELKDRMLDLGANVLEVDKGDLEMRDGEIQVRGAPEESVTLEGLAKQFYFEPGPQFTASEEMLTEGESTLEVTEAWFSPLTAENPMAIYTTHPSAASAVVVEVDVETGEIEIRDRVWAHDCGVVINPGNVEAQLHGGTAQGIGGTLYEELAYDENGQLVTSSYKDYLLPTAMEVPDIEIHHQETPAPYTELGTKGMAEGGTILPPSTIVNAVEDALEPFDVTIDRTPLKPDYVRQLVREAQDEAS